MHEETCLDVSKDVTVTKIMSLGTAHHAGLHGWNISAQSCQFHHGEVRLSSSYFTNSFWGTTSTSNVESKKKKKKQSSATSSTWSPASNVTSSKNDENKLAWKSFQSIARKIEAVRKVKCDPGKKCAEIWFCLSFDKNIMSCFWIKIQCLSMQHLACSSSEMFQCLKH